MSDSYMTCIFHLCHKPQRCIANDVWLHEKNGYDLLPAIFRRSQWVFFRFFFRSVHHRVDAEKEEGWTRNFWNRGTGWYNSSNTRECPHRKCRIALRRWSFWWFQKNLLRNRRRKAWLFGMRQWRNKVCPEVWTRMDRDFQPQYQSLWQQPGIQESG